VAAAEDLAPHLDALERAIAAASGPAEIRRLGAMLGDLTAALDMRIAGVGRGQAEVVLDRILEPEEVAKRLGQSKSWVYAHQAELRELRVPMPGNRLKFSERRLEKFIERRGA
jgi:predicted DNA-binding transcriptional regulator AlpA